MTSIVGILCKDGVVIGTDSSATFGTISLHTIEQEIKKIEVFGKEVIVAGTGQIGLNQRFCQIVEDAYGKKLFNQKHVPVGVNLAKSARTDFASTGVREGQYGALLAYTNGNEYFLCEFSSQDFQPEWKKIDSKLWFVSMGCGQPITDPFLGLMRKVFWRNEPPAVADAIFVATWTLQHAIDLNTGGINAPIQMAVIRKRTDSKHYEAMMLPSEELFEHQNNVECAEAYLAKYKDILLGSESPKEIPHLNAED